MYNNNNYSYHYIILVLFIIIMDVLTENIEWVMMFADDLVLCAMTREEVEEDLETCRVVVEGHGLKISRIRQNNCRAPQMIQKPP